MHFPMDFHELMMEMSLRLLAKLFTPEEAELASNLSLDLETAATIADRIDMEPQEV